MIIALRIALSVFLFSSGLLFAERLIVYAFDPRSVDPASLDLNVTTSSFHAPSGFEITLWSAPPAPGMPTVLYLHGNAGNLANRRGRFKRFLDRGYGLIAPGYPGSSGSSGWPSQERLTQTMAELYHALSDGQITGAPLPPVLYGESLGAAVALQIIAQDPARQPRAVILEAPFTSLRHVARDLSSWADALSPLLTSSWLSLEAAPSLHAPVLVIHGAQDALIPVEQGRAIHNAAGSADKEFHLVEDAGHIDVWKLTAQRHLFDWLAAR